ncbi:MAG: HD domain-containing protein, partial [bacterium]|nr:HD domain-containing protein [bacterium]
MRNILKFFLEISKLKDVERKGITFYGVKNPDSATDHTFRSAMMAWVFGAMNKNLNVEKVIKLTLIHDIYKIYLGDATPYAGLLPKNKKKKAEFVKRWRRLFQARKERRYNKKYAKQYEVFRKLFQNLPQELRKEAVS